ncbi:MAG: hypothetical protein ACOC44_05315 [Promethearchaeia archaeon]
MQVREKKYKNTHRVLSQLGLEERVIEVYLHCFRKNAGKTDLVEVGKELQIPEKKLRKMLNTLQKKNLVELEKIEHNIAIKANAPLPIMVSLVTYVSESIERLRKHLPKVLEQQLKIVKQNEEEKFHIKEFEDYLQKTRKEMPEIIEKEYQRYHQILEGSNIFKEIMDNLQNLNLSVQSIEDIIAEEMEYEKSFLTKTQEKVKKKFKEEFEMEELAEFSANLFNELFREHFNKLTEAYIDRLRIVTENLTGERMERLENLAEVADQASVDLDIAFMAIKTGMEAILSDFDKRLNQVHTEIDSKIEGLTNSFKKALNRSFHEGAVSKILNFLELVGESLKELQAIQ